MTPAQRVANLQARIAAPEFADALGGQQSVGRLTRIVGLTMEATGCLLTVGARCQVQGSNRVVDAEVVGFHGERSLLMPFVGIAIFLGYSLRTSRAVSKLTSSSEVARIIACAVANCAASRASA